MHCTLTPTVEALLQLTFCEPHSTRSHYALQIIRCKCNFEKWGSKLSESYSYYISVTLTSPAHLACIRLNEPFYECSLQTFVFYFFFIQLHPVSTTIGI